MLKGFFHLSLVLSSCFSTNFVFSQAGKDGTETITVTGIVFNRYDVLSTTITAGSNTATVTNIANLAGGAAGANNPYATSALSYGDLIMVIKMQGASIDATNTSSYGSITAFNGAGTYELATVSGVTGNTITICNTFANAFTVSGTQRVQIVRIPRLNDLTINSGASLTANAWNGSTGGIVAVEVTGNTVVNGSIIATGLGYRGGALDNNANNPGASTYVSTSSFDGAEKGESVAGYQTDYDGLGGRFNKGAPANGGGGGNAHNGGGGGGANAGAIASWNGNGNPDNSGGAGWTSAWNLESASFATNTSTGGGRGGYTYAANNQDATTTAPGNTAWGGDNRKNNGGIGGRPLTYSSSTLFLGGGGGAGDANNNSGGAGGNGGGIIYLLVTGTLSGTGSITANGNNGASANNTFNDAPGGGGGGGAIGLNIQGTISGITVSANGGTGGSQGITSAESEGPGGGGGGGYISVPGTPAITMSVTGGANGITTSSSLTEFTPNGATSGGAGSSLTSQAYVAAPAVSCSALPLTLISFSATLQSNNKVNVSWSTADEENVDHFEIEVSNSQQQWKTVVSKPALNQQSAHYEVLIDAYSSEFYIRVKTVDADGSNQYSIIKTISVPGLKPLLTVNGNVLTLERLPDNARQVSIYNASGQLYKTQSKNPVRNVETININGLPPGVYYLLLNTDSGKKHFKFIRSY
ncbi:MAG TPA: T9SS type A sorting domain-containing protein [Niastella sp.]